MPRREVEAPIVAPHELSGRILEIDIAEKYEADLAADRVRCSVLNGGKRVQISACVLCGGDVDELAGRPAGNSSSVMFGEHRPPDLIDTPVSPGALPISDPADRLAGALEGDTELPRTGALVAGLSFSDLLGSLRSAEVLHHPRVAQESLQEPQVGRGPRLDPDRVASTHVAVSLAKGHRQSCGRVQQTLFLVPVRVAMTLRYLAN